MSGAEAAASIVDAHAHVWDPRVLAYPWLPEDAAPSLPAEIDRANGAVSRMVFVEAGCRPDHNLAEVEWIEEFGQSWPELAGIVAAADLRRDDVSGDLARLRAAGRIVGIRHQLQSEPVEAFADPRLLRGLRTLADEGLRFDACVQHPQLDALMTLLEQVPELPVVLDHVGKPPVTAGPDGEAAARWRDAIDRLAQLPRMHVKLSGLPAEASDTPTLRAHAPAFLLYALAAFGPDRSMLASDWPVSARWGAGGSFADWADLVRGACGESAWPAVAGATAARFYGLDGA